MLNLRYFVLSAALAASALTLAACGGGDDDDGGGDPTATTGSGSASATTGAVSTTTGGSGSNPAPTTAGGNAPTTAPNASPTTGSSGGGSGSITGSGANDFKNIAKDLSKKTFSVTYEFDDGGGDPGSIGTITLVQKPPKSATIITSTGGDSIFIDDGTNSFTCTKSGEDPGACFKAASSGGLLTEGAFNLDAILTELDTNLEVVKDGEERIADRNASCFIIKETGLTDSRACFDKNDGYMLMLDSSEGEEKNVIRATKISTSVPDSTFEPPYEVTTLP